MTTTASDNKAGELSRLEAAVSGSVQGVGFRYFASDAARKLGLTGWVRNLPDGSVQVVAEGPHEKVEMLVEELRHGPKAGRVDRVHSSWQTYRGEFDRFEVKF